ncbi:LysR substrate-binding domain-containing protein [Methyloprofundus sedimenti]|uniref:LysR substrate-binding domain-containing protein n=1 Tax=Methyloprofundus sedimenti TaxID=1420851 RepID=UPI001E47BF32|nr:LysR substrate-binding domain-containing protein [Methyloprofundus sedimenti]
MHYPADSQHPNQKMEESLGVQIFERSNKKVIPTETGATVIASARRILNEIQQINELAELAQDPLSGNFRLGAFPTLSTYIFPDLVPAIKQQLPKIRLILIEEKTDTLIEQLKQGKLDVALLSLPINGDTLQYEHLFEDVFKLAVATDHPLASKKIIKQSDLRQQQLLLLDEGHCLRGQALQFCQLNGAEEQQDVRATGLETLRQMVRAGTGITFIPEIAMRKPDPGICYLSFAEPVPSRNIGLVWRKTSAKTHLIKQFISLIKNTANS